MSADPVFPPLLSGYAVKAQRSAFIEAARLAERHVRGAGDVIWSRATRRVDLAIILEPEVALARAQQMAPMTMVALGNALGSLCPPQVGIQYLWPGSIMINGGKAGRVRLAAATCGSLDVPRWLVVGIDLRLVHDDQRVEPGETPNETCLAEEGLGTVSRSDVISSFAAYWMAALNNWQDDGFHRIAEHWMFRAAGTTQDIEVTHAGRKINGKIKGLDDEAGVLIKPDGAPGQVLGYAGYVGQSLNDPEAP